MRSTAAGGRNLFFEKILDKGQNADNIEDHLRGVGNNRERHVKSHHKDHLLFWRDNMFYTAHYTIILL
jgi:hypothetical protein